MLDLTNFQQKAISDTSIYLTNNNLTLSVAESCTGGLIASCFTSQSGSSKFFKGGVVAYSNQLKYELLSIHELDILKFGVVSKNVVELMASNIREKCNVDISIASTGWMDFSIDKTLNEAWIAISNQGNITSKHIVLNQSRSENTALVVTQALMLLRKAIV